MSLNPGSALAYCHLAMSLTIAPLCLDITQTKWCLHLEGRGSEEGRGEQLLE